MINFTSDFPCHPFDRLTEDPIKSIVKWGGHVLNKHTDVISNVGILVITTCLLASKIFQRIPKILPSLSKIVFNYGGIIWLNVQFRDWKKSTGDFARAYESKDLSGMVETSAKVFVKTFNIFFTCVLFAGSVVSTFVYPQASLILGLTFRSLSLSCLMINVASDLRDYFINEKLLRQIETIESHPKGSLLIGKVMICFLEIVKDKKILPSDLRNEEYNLADKLVRQLDTYTLETFKESLDKNRKERNPLIDALKLFYGVKDGMVNSQATAKANLSLTTFGYLSMGICRAFPDSLVEMLTRWIISVLYTDDFIQRKFFQVQLAEKIN